MVKTEARVSAGKTFVTMWVPQATCPLLEVFHLKLVDTLPPADLHLALLYSPVLPDFEVVSYVHGLL